MTEVVANCNFNKTDFSVKNLGLELDGCQSAEVEAILKAAAESQLWKSVEKHANEVIPEPVMEAAKFAVEQHNKDAGTKLVLLRVLNWRERPFLIGTFYELFMSVKDGPAKRKAAALVVRPINGPMMLIWWRDLYLSA